MIIALEEAKYALVNMRESIEDLGSALRVDELRALCVDFFRYTRRVVEIVRNSAISSGIFLCISG